MPDVDPSVLIPPTPLSVEDVQEVAWLLHPRGGGYCAVTPYPAIGAYVAVKELLNDELALVLGVLGDRLGFEDQWLYDSAEKASDALFGWSPLNGGEPRGWFRHPRTGRRRAPDGREYVAH